MTLAARGLRLAGRLAGIDATLAPGAITAICGPNGAGKSTLLACLAGLLAPDEGDVLLDDQPLATLDARERARALGFLPQIPEIAWDVSVEVLVSLGRLPWAGIKLADASDSVDRALERMDLGDLRMRPMSRLSGGERVRALLARVMAGDPRWLLADEPLASLDLAHARDVCASLGEEAARGRGVVLVLHDLAVAMNHAQRVIVLSQGRIAADGPPAEALSAEVIAQVWGIDAHWLGSPGAMALALS